MDALSRSDPAQRQMAEVDIFKTVLFYVFLILFVPVASFFASRGVLAEVFSVDTTTSTLYAATLTVVVVHGVLGMFVMRAFNDGDKASKMD